jgi:hypothetical protein
MVDIARREAIFLWYYFTILLQQIGLYWFLGMMLGSFISVFGKERIHNLFYSLQKSRIEIFGIIPSCLIGIISPLCMYGTIPIAVSFSKKGIRDDWLAAFMMCSILLNPQLIFYSVALGNAALLIRIVSCFLSGIAAGLLVHFVFKGSKFFNLKSFGETENRDIHPNIFLRFAKNFLRNVKATGPAFLIGLSLAALFQRYIPDNAFAALFGRHRGFGLLMAASIGVPLYVCGGGTIPLIQTWLQRGMSMGAATTFMIAGPAMKITNIGAVKIILKLKHFLLYLLFAIVFALLSGFAIDYIFKIG